MDPNNRILYGGFNGFKEFYNKTNPYQAIPQFAPAPLPPNQFSGPYPVNQLNHQFTQYMPNEIPQLSFFNSSHLNGLSGFDGHGFGDPEYGLTDAGYIFEDEYKDGLEYSKKKNRKKKIKGAALSTLTLLAFMFFLHILQSSLSEYVGNGYYYPYDNGFVANNVEILARTEDKPETNKVYSEKVFNSVESDPMQNKYQELPVEDYSESIPDNSINYKMSKLTKISKLQNALKNAKSPESKKQTISSKLANAFRMEPEPRL